MKYVVCFERREIVGELMSQTFLVVSQTEKKGEKTEKKGEKTEKKGEKTSPLRLSIGPSASRNYR